MQISTTRFGTVRATADDLFLFPQGLIGFEDCQQWVLLADAHTPAVGWLQSVPHAEIAVAVVSPRQFAPEYRFHVRREQLAAVELAELDRAFVLAVVGQHEGMLTANLKAPILFNLDRRRGCQLVALDEQPLRLALAPADRQLRKTA